MLFRSKERLEKDGHETPNGYTHLYNYKTDTKGNILIKDVYSYGGAKVYNEIKQLLVKGEIKLALRVLNSIKKATSLSSATTEIVTNPTESHEETIRQIESRKINHQVIEESIDYTKEGWTRVVPTEEESSVSYMWFEKNGERHSIKDIAEEMRLKDPVVLQTTVVKVL